MVDGTCWFRQWNGFDIAWEDGTPQCSPRLARIPYQQTSPMLFSSEKLCNKLTWIACERSEFSYGVGNGGDENGVEVIMVGL